MASVYDFKPRFQAVLRPLAGRLAASGITANEVTLAALVLSLLHGLWLALAPSSAALLLLPVTLFIRMALNALDGMLAREFGQKSRLGAILNEVCDMLSDAALYLPFALIAGVPGPLVVIVVTLAVIGEAVGILGPSLGASRRYDGPMGKSDRALMFGLYAVVLGIGATPGLGSLIFLLALTALSAATILNRARAILREAAQAAPAAPR